MNRRCRPDCPCGHEDSWRASCRSRRSSHRCAAARHRSPRSGSIPDAADRTCCPSARTRRRRPAAHSRTPRRRPSPHRPPPRRSRPSRISKPRRLRLCSGRGRRRRTDTPSRRSAGSAAPQRPCRHRRPFRQRPTRRARRPPSEPSPRAAPEPASSDEPSGDPPPDAICRPHPSPTAIPTLTGRRRTTGIAAGCARRQTAAPHCPQRLSPRPQCRS